MISLFFNQQLGRLSTRTLTNDKELILPPFGFLLYCYIVSTMLCCHSVATMLLYPSPPSTTPPSRQDLWLVLAALVCVCSDQSPSFTFNTSNLTAWLWQDGGQSGRSNLRRRGISPLYRYLWIRQSSLIPRSIPPQSIASDVTSSQQEMVQWSRWAGAARAEQCARGGRGREKTLWTAL